jgi:hypothetical protein
VPGALGGDAFAISGRGPDDLADFVRVLRHSNPGRLLVDHEIERAAFAVPVGGVL